MAVAGFEFVTVGCNSKTSWPIWARSLMDARLIELIMMVITNRQIADGRRLLKMYRIDDREEVHNDLHT